MDRTFLGDFDQPLPLIVRERALEIDLPVDAIESALPRVAVRTVLCPHLRVRELNANVSQRPLLAACIHRDRHRRARPEGGEQQLIRIRSGVPAAGGDRFVGYELVRAGSDALGEARTITLDCHQRFTSSASAHHRSPPVRSLSSAYRALRPSCLSRLPAFPAVPPLLPFLPLLPLLPVLPVPPLLPLLPLPRPAHPSAQP